MKSVKRLLLRKNGTITLFAALSMTFLILFFMVLIDISRLFLFSKLTESSAKLASRSVMSAYDLLLYEKYGLFGKGGTDGQLIAEQIMKSNIATELNVFDVASAIQLTPIDISSVNVIYDHFLGEHGELEQQIVEEMKYKAPIDFSIEIIETFTDFEQAGQVANSLVKSLNTLQDLYEKRESTIELLYETQQDISQLGDGDANQNFNSIISGYSSYIGNLNSETSLYEEREKFLNNDKKMSEAEIKELENINSRLESVQRAINQYLASSNESLLTSEKKQEKMENALIVLANSITENLNLAQTLNNTIKIQYEMLLMKQQQQVAVSDGGNTILSQLEMEFTDEGLVRSPQFFSQYDKELNDQISTFREYISKAKQFIQATRQAIQSPNLQQSSSPTMDAAYNKFTSVHNTVVTKYISPATVLNQRRLQINEQESIKQQLQQDKQDYRQLLQEMDYLAQLAIIYEKLQQDKQSFEKVQQYYKRNLERNLSYDDGIKNSSEGMSTNGNKNAENSLGQFTGLVANMNRLTKQLQSHLYRNEYVIQRFKHLPLGDLNQFVHKQKDSINFHHQAVEYIIHGFSEPSANISIVMAEIFAIRLAIRTIEGLIANKHLANPILVVSSAIVYGLQHAVRDMNELLDDGETELSKYAKVDVSYRHYLRLLLCIHGLAKTKTLSRIAAVIEHDLQLDLMQVPTSSILITETNTKLWILPAVSNIISNTMAQSIQVENGYYEKVDYAASSY